MKRIRYIFPKTANFREERPRICWEHMYGWMESYGVLFDPKVQSITGIIPEWENGCDGNFKEGDFIITSCAQASENFENLECPGLYVRPTNGVEIHERGSLSGKEKLFTPLGDFYYPCGLTFDRYKGTSAAWKMGDMSAIAMKGNSLALGFEIFGMLGYFRNEMPVQCFTSCADMVARLLEECGLRASQNNIMSKWQSDTRIDFQAYGVNRLFIQWLLVMNNVSKNTVEDADKFYSNALVAWNAGAEGKTVELLGKAFKKLAELRAGISQTDLLFLEYPHIGILFEDKGFFEFEWPEFSRRLFSSFFDVIGKYGYKTSIEAGASCWKNLTSRYPEIGMKLKECRDKKTIEFTNGTFSLPYALMSPLSLQYWQFKRGQETFMKTFGSVPDTYQCQENSFTAQMPELLKYFGYTRVLHITQNHGDAPSDKEGFIKWVSPAGHGLITMTAPNSALGRKGNNYFLDLPLVHNEYGVKNKRLNYVNFQDLSYAPFRIHMILAHKYAPVWGRFALPEEAFKDVSEDALEAKSYYADAYKFSEKFFYPNETNVNALSHYERIYSLTGLRRQLLFAAYATGKLSELFNEINEVIEKLCLMEAHDCCYVQGQRKGEYAPQLIENPPYSRETLAQRITEIASSVSCALNKVNEKIAGENSLTLYNAAEAMLSFAKLKSSLKFDGKIAVHYDGKVYAIGPFKAFSSSEARAMSEMKDATLPFDNGIWKIEIESSKIALSYKGQKFSFSPIDKKNGQFKLLKSELKKAGALNFAKFTWMLENPDVQTVLTSVVFSDDGDYAEINVKYSPRHSFDAAVKWSDYLALEFNTDSSIDSAFRFNPNVRSLSAENRVASPYYLAIESSDKTSASFMNEGASLYELDRKNGKVNWLFHVACETVHERRMGIAFGKTDAFQLSRAWGQGLLNIKSEISPLLEDVDWQDVSVEDFVTPDTLLISNLSGRNRELKINQNLFSSAENMLGENIVGKNNLKLKPMELALVHI